MLTPRELHDIETIAADAPSVASALGSYRRYLADCDAIRAEQQTLDERLASAGRALKALHLAQQVARIPAAEITEAEATYEDVCQARATLGERSRAAYRQLYAAEGSLISAVRAAGYTTPFV